MNLLLEDNLEKEAWERALLSLPDAGELLQSGIWKNIVLSEKYIVRRFAWRRRGKLVVLAQVLESGLSGFKTWYLPRGPVLLQAIDEEQYLWREVLADLRRLAIARQIMSIRFEPESWPLNLDFLGKKIKSIQPEKSLFLDLSLSEEELLSRMHPKTRYNIRLAEKKGVEIIQGNLDNLSDFWLLLQATTSRDGFRGHGLVHYRKLLEQGRGTIELWLAQREGRVLAAGIFSFYGGRAVYLHGASADQERQYMAPYLLQWRMIQRARFRSCRYYDFYGIDEKKWPGVTRFKLGFGGEERIYPGTFLLVISPWRQSFYNFLARLSALFGF